MENTPAAATGAPPLTGNVLFYQQPEPLSVEAHSHLGVKQIAQPFAFLAAAHAVPVTVTEFGMVAGCYPVIFVGEEKTPIAVMGVRQGQNLYVDANGQPEADHYIPAFARRYPFVFASDSVWCLKYRHSCVILMTSYPVSIRTSKSSGSVTSVTATCT